MLAASRKDLERVEKGVQWQLTITAMKTSERGGLQEMDMAVTSSYLPHSFVGWNTLHANSKPKHYIHTRR